MDNAISGSLERQSSCIALASTIRGIPTSQNARFLNNSTTKWPSWPPPNRISNPPAPSILQRNLLRLAKSSTAFATYWQSSIDCRNSNWTIRKFLHFSVTVPRGVVEPPDVEDENDMDIEPFIACCCCCCLCISTSTKSTFLCKMT